MLVSTVKDTEKEIRKMTKKYFAVTVKFGHVGQHKYIIKTVPIEAESGKDAAYQARWMPRVKHHDKHAIISVIEIDLEVYLLLMIDKSFDPYFQCKNIQEQRNVCEGIEEDVQYMETDEIDYELREKTRKNKVNFKNKKNKLIKNDYQYMMRNYELSLSY